VPNQSSLCTGCPPPLARVTIGGRVLAVAATGLAVTAPLALVTTALEPLVGAHSRAAKSTETEHGGAGHELRSSVVHESLLRRSVDPFCAGVGKA
jgi:hypothetical protein